MAYLVSHPDVVNVISWRFGKGATSIDKYIELEGYQSARKALEQLFAEETKIDQAARLKISSQRKIIQEGTQEWDILYRKYYNDEVRRLGI